MPTPTDLRSAVRDLSMLAAADLRGLWRQVSNLDEAQAALEDVLPLLVRTYGTAASTVAADWYDETRDELNIDRRFFAIVNEIDDQGADVLARWGVAPLLGPSPDWRRAQVLIEGGLQKRIANGARETVMRSAEQDPSAEGWQRSASGGCNFCQMLAGNGLVYRSASVDFGAHDNCQCVAVAAFSGREKPVKPYTPTTRDITDADKARTREWMREHLPGVRG